ncbi:e9imm peptide [Streptomyces sp. NPDC049040]|uniref:e9imm peptide n=1 Tax=Streptomyces sp. NPDC049040 TaxID=3365593 RepID=UPI00372448BE
MTRETAVALVQDVMNVEYDEDEMERVLDELDKALGCPTGHVGGLIFWPKDGLEPTAAEVVDQALAYQPFAL